MRRRPLAPPPSSARQRRILWVPQTLATVSSGVTFEVGRPAAMVALALWAAVPAVAGLLAVQRRDVV